MAGVHPRARSFDGAAAAYERGRPGWPPEAVEIAARRLGLGRGSAVLDLAAGTGKLTRLLVMRFGAVTAVEPLDEMRAVLAAEVPSARALAGTAEAIPLPGAAVDAVFVAEAIHWFDPERAVAEIARVLRPGGGLAVLYNRRDWEAAAGGWGAEANEAFKRHRLPEDDVDPHDESRWRAALAALGAVRTDAIESHVHRIGPDEVVDMYASYSGLAGLPRDRREAALAEIRAIVVRHAVREAELAYRTEVTTVRMR